MIISAELRACRSTNGIVTTATGKSRLIIKSIDSSGNRVYETRWYGARKQKKAHAELDHFTTLIRLAEAEHKVEEVKPTHQEPTHLFDQLAIGSVFVEPDKGGRYIKVGHTVAVDMDKKRHCFWPYDETMRIGQARPHTYERIS